MEKNTHTHIQVIDILLLSKFLHARITVLVIAVFSPYCHPRCIPFYVLLARRRDRTIIRVELEENKKYRDKNDEQKCKKNRR